MTDDDLATSAPGRLDRAGMRRVGSMGPNMFAMLGTSGGASVPRSGSQQSLATVDEMDPVERVRKRRRVSAQRSRVRKAMYILSLENENKLLRAELQRLHAATQAGAPQVLQAKGPPTTERSIARRSPDAAGAGARPPPSFIFLSPALIFLSPPPPSRRGAPLARSLARGAAAINSILNPK